MDVDGSDRVATGAAGGASSSGPGRSAAEAAGGAGAAGATTTAGRAVDRDGDTPMGGSVAAAATAAPGGKEDDRNGGAAAAAAAAGPSGGGGSSSGGGGAFEMPWVEKYRPRRVCDIVGNVDAVSRLQVIAQYGNMPNLILSGPPGTGKTTSVLALAHEMLGANYKEAVLELNASDDRGIDVVRNKIKMFAQKKVTLPNGRHKIILLDEADSMTAGAQQALRRTMEIYSSTTRFALACNLSSKIIEPIQSRCAIVRFNRLTDVEVLDRLLFVAQQEKVPYVPEGLEALVFTADGDMRQALNNLQATHTGFGFVSPDNVFKVCDQPHPLLVSSIVKNCLEGRVDDACATMLRLFSLGYAGSDIITTLFRIVKNYDMPEYLKLEFIREVGFCHMRIADGVGTPLQLSGLVAKLCRVRNSSRPP